MRAPRAAHDSHYRYGRDVDERMLRHDYDAGGGFYDRGLAI